MQGAPPPRGAPAGGQEPLRAEDLRGLRRWVIVAVVWAVAATAVALIALLDTSQNDAEQEAEDTSRRVTRVERTLDGRIDALEKRLDELPRSEDVSKLEGRLTRAERTVSAASRNARSADRTVTDLEGRIEQLEEEDGGGETSPDEPPP